MEQQQVIIYTRVSTDEQAEKGFSLRSQLSILQTYCNAKDITILKHFEDDCSAKTFDRPGWKQLMQYVKANKRQVDEILFQKWDRFSRNMEGALTTIRELKEIGVKVHALEQPLDLDISDSKLMLSIYLAIPEVENDKNSSRTKAGMRRANFEGCWTGTPPFGYKCSRNEDEKSTLEICPERATLVKEAFETYAKGCYHAGEVRRMFLGKGLKVSEEQFRNMLQNVAYTGKVKVRAFGKEDEQIVKGLHLPIIEDSVFERIQKIYAKNSKGKKPASLKIQNEAFLLKGHLVCPVCSGHVTGSCSKGNGGYFAYYHCMNSKCKHRHNAIKANSTFSEYLTALNVKEEVLELYYEVMSDIFSSDEVKVKGQIDTINKQIADAESLLQSAQDKFLNNTIDSKDYGDIKKRYTTKLNDLRAQKEGLINQDSNMTKYMKYAFGLLQNLSQHYQQANFDLKQKMLGSIFPEKLVFDGLTFRTTSKDNLIELLYNGSNGFKASKKEKAEKNSRLPYQGSPSWARTKDPIINSHVL